HLPELLDAEGIKWRLIALSERNTSQQSLGYVAAHPVSEDRDLSPDIHSGLERLFGLPVSPDSTITRPHADDTAAVHQDVARSKSSKYIDAFGFDLCCQPLAHLLKRDDEVPMISEWWRREGEPELARFAEEVHEIVCNGRSKRRAASDEIGHQLGKRTRIEHCAREQMRTRL